MSNWSNNLKNIYRILENRHHNGISFLQDDGQRWKRNQQQQVKPRINIKHPTKPNKQFEGIKMFEKGNGGRGNSRRNNSQRDKNLIYYNCGKPGYKSYKCPELQKKRKATNLLMATNAKHKDNLATGEFAFIMRR